MKTEKRKVTFIPNGFQKDYTINFVNAIADNGVKVDFLGSDDYPLYKFHKKVNFLNLRGSHNHNVSALAKIVRVLKYYIRLAVYTLRTKNKIFHVGWLRFNFFDGVVINTFFKLTGKKIIYTAHNILPHGKSGLFVKLCFKIIYRIPAVILVHTEYIREQIIKNFDIQKSKIIVVKHGVCKVKDHPFISRARAREFLSLPQDSKIVLFFGNINRYKGLDILLRAFSLLKNKEKKILLIIAGLPDKRYEVELIKMLTPEKITNRISTFLRYIDDDEMEMLFKASDIVAMPYLEASQSGILFLSYAYNRPVVASRLGGFLFDVIDGRTGYLFPPGSYLDLTFKIWNYFNNTEQNRVQMEKFIEKDIKPKYSWYQTGKQVGGVYEREYSRNERKKIRHNIAGKKRSEVHRQYA
jgi:glycosyltransferase involved in cell wall biosynthesis